MRKFEQAFKVLTVIRASVRGKDGYRAKRLIGDSTKNNRTLTVNQTIRLFEKLNIREVAKILNVASNVLEDEIIRKRKHRSDALDLEELVSTYREILMNKRNSTYRRRMSNALSKVGF